MDQFGLLSLEDNDHEETNLNSKILNLSLTDTDVVPNSHSNSMVLTNSVIQKQVAGNFNSDNNINNINNINNNVPDPMEIDTDMDVDMVDVQSVSLDKENDGDTGIQFGSGKKVNEEVPKAEIVADDFLTDVESVDSNKSDITDKNKQVITTVSKLLSPTQLGASLVKNSTHNTTTTTTNNNNNNNKNNNHLESLSDRLDSNKETQKENKVNNNKSSSSKDSYDMIRHNKEIWKQILTDKQLINVNINNHNYFHPPVNHSNINQMNDNESDYPFNENLIVERKQDNVLLPYPWSSTSTPYFKKWYNTISYIQWILNFGSIIFIIFIIMSSIRKDLRSIWYQNKISLINESQNCQLQYNLNDCDINFKLPEMSEICQDWWICAHRDNNKLINNRTNLLIKFLTSLINEFFNGLDIKTLVVTTILTFGWFFISNFTMGFIRAKSYYGNGYSKQNKQ